MKYQMKIIKRVIQWFSDIWDILNFPKNFNKNMEYVDCIWEDFE